jgi:para-nitrobenzyl esterase
MTISVRLAAMAALVALAGCMSSEAPETTVEAAQDTQRTLGQGEIVGFHSTENASAWLAVPYAAPPVGELRWRAPRAPLAFPGRSLEALEHGPRCPQITNVLSNTAEGLEPGHLIGSEDCLTLDIYAPRDAAPGDALPVMVWIHGGANVWGSTIAYDGSQLAAERDVVVVAVQYRLGPLGFLSHPALRDSAEVPEDEAANFALLDLAAALDWVETNIDAFGGDPQRVTIFGESAGGYNVAGLMASPPARGRFHRAIMQSGGTASLTVAEAEEGGGVDLHPALEAVAEFAGPDADAAAMRAADLDAIYDVYRGEDGTFSSLPRMIEDGVSLPEGGILEAAATPGGFAPVPLITGTNHDEMKLYTVFDPRLTRRLGPLIWPRDTGRYNAAAEYPSRNWRVNAVDGLLDRLHAAGHEDIWAYRFDWDEGGRVLLTDTGTLLGASHAMEIPFVFNHFELFGSFDSVLFNDGNAEGRAALADAMGAYWARFAATGAPGDGAGAGPDWPRWDDEARLMRFDTPAGGGPEVIAGRESLEQIAGDLAEDPRLEPAERCTIAAGIERRQPETAAILAGPLDC